MIRTFEISDATTVGDFLQFIESIRERHYVALVLRKDAKPQKQFYILRKDLIEEIRNLFQKGILVLGDGFSKTTSSINILLSRSKVHTSWNYYFSLRIMPAFLDEAVRNGFDFTQPIQGGLLPGDTGVSRKFRDDERGLIWGRVPERESNLIPAYSVSKLKKRQFRAEPFISAFEPEIKPGETMNVAVGFSRILAKGLKDVQSFDVEVGEDEVCEVRIKSKGLKLSTSEFALPFEDDATKTIECTVEDDATEIELQVLYYLGSKQIGSATRRQSFVDRKTESVEERFSVMAVDAKDTGIDLFAHVTYQDNGKLQWVITSNGKVSSVVETAMTDARGFAVQYTRNINNSNASASMASLKACAIKVRKTMPAEFWSQLQAVAAKKKNEVPIVLITTNEAYMPWELAHVPEDAPITKKKQNFLGCQVIMSRWIDDGVVPCIPKAKVTIENITAIAAQYGGTSDQPELEHAVKEQEYLSKDWNATPIEAELGKIEAILNAGLQGHLLHFAVHGITNSTANSSEIICSDKCRVSSDYFLTEYNPQKPPIVTFMFLNACQIGGVGTSLGQVDGFPGNLVSSGSQGFIGALWNINDGLAFPCAKRFYEKVLRQGGTTGAALLECRQGFTGESTTPMAYVYYGHPCLKFTRKGNS